MRFYSDFYYKWEWLTYQMFKGRIFIAFCITICPCLFTCFSIWSFLFYLYMRYISLLSYLKYIIHISPSFVSFWLCGLVGFLLCKKSSLTHFYKLKFTNFFLFLLLVPSHRKPSFTQVTEESIHVSFLYSYSFIIYIKVFGSFATYFSVWCESVNLILSFKWLIIS